MSAEYTLVDRPAKSAAQGFVGQAWNGRTKYLVGAGLIALSAIMLAPLVLTVLASLKSTIEQAAVPPTYFTHALSLDSYAKLWSYQDGLPTYLFNSAATAVLAGSKLTVNGTFDGLLSSATTAQVHRGPAMGVRGPSFAELTVSKAQKGTLSGAIDLTPEQVQALKKGQLYIQVSSEKAPDGNLWGWFVR